MTDTTRIRRGKPCIGPDGKQYHSEAAAARALGMSHTSAQWHLNRYGCLTRLGEGNGQPVSDGKQTWPSITAAAQALGVSIGSIRHHLQMHGHLGNIGKLAGRRWSKPIQIGPVSWPAVKDAARDLGVSRVTLRKWVRDDATEADRRRMAERLEAYLKPRREAAEDALRQKMQAAAKREGNSPKAWKQEIILTRPTGRAAIYDPAHIMALLASGKTVPEVCAETGAGDSTVRRIRLAENGSRRAAA